MQVGDELNLPIDIHTNKLLDWLISRRHCNQEWQNQVQTIREKINSAIQDMPAVDEIVKLLSGSYINYFHCVRIVELLKDTEKATRNIFGGYSSQRMKDWQEIVKLYEKDNVYLAEAAQMLIRNVIYEIPSMKKQITKCHQILEECDKRELDFQRKANELHEKYNTSCKQLGIEGTKIKTEIVALLDKLPIMYDEIAGNFKNLEEASQYYSAFREFTLERKADNVLPMLKFLIDNGNVTTYEWKKGKKPKEVHVSKLQISTDDENVNENDTIDFGSDVIDFGDEVSNEISWDISVDENPTESKIEVDDEIARGELALSILDNSTTRNTVIDELSELESFLDQRLIELQSEGTALSFDSFQNTNANALMQSTETVVTMLGQVRRILNSLTNVKILNLQLIRSSPNYVERVCQTLKQKLTASENVLKRKDEIGIKRNRIIEEEKDLHPRLKLITSRTAELQSQIEEDISKRYKNRPVNLMGGVNSI